MNAETYWGEFIIYLITKKLKEKGFSDELIAVLHDVIRSIDPETNEKVRRIKEIMLHRWHR